MDEDSLAKQLVGYPAKLISSSMFLRNGEMQRQRIITERKKQSLTTFSSTQVFVKLSRKSLKGSDKN